MPLLFTAKTMFTVEKSLLSRSAKVQLFKKQKKGFYRANLSDLFGPVRIIKILHEFGMTVRVQAIPNSPRYEKVELNIAA